MCGSLSGTANGIRCVDMHCSLERWKGRERWGRKGGREAGREGGREEGRKEGGREEGREEGREGGREEEGGWVTLPMYS